MFSDTHESWDQEQLAFRLSALSAAAGTATDGDVDAFTACIGYEAADPSLQSVFWDEVAATKLQRGPR